MIIDIRNSIFSLLIVIIAFLSLSAYYGLDFWLVQKPMSVHVWRQSDCASYALNYFQNDRGLFSPQVHHRHAIDGNTCSEFPIIYYGASKIYKLFGFHDYYIRWIDYFIFFIGLLGITLASAYYIKDKFLVAMPAILLMMSCVIVYYAANFLPDVPALMLALLGFYFYTRYIFHFKTSDILLAVFFSTFAALLKISSALIFVCIILYTLYLKVIKKESRVTLGQISSTFVGVLSVAAWLAYVKWYNNQGQYFGNLQGTMGIWLCDKNKILYILQRTMEEWVPALASRKLWLLFVPVLIYIFYFRKKLEPILHFFLPLLFLGCVFYIIAWFNVFDVHDYYFINVFCFPVLAAIAFLSLIEKQLNQKQIKIFLLLSLVLFAMTAEDTKAQFYNRKWHTGWNSSPPKGFYRIEPYLRSIGIDRHELIFSPSDGSTNITLYLANNPGWTSLFGTSAQSAKERGGKYMLIEKSQLDTEEYSQYKAQVIGEFEGIMVVKF